MGPSQFNREFDENLGLQSVYLAILRVCDLFGMVSENVTLSRANRDLQRLGIKRSRLESPGSCLVYDSKKKIRWSQQGILRCRILQNIFPPWRRAPCFCSSSSLRCQMLNNLFFWTLLQGSIRNCDAVTSQIVRCWKEKMRRSNLQWFLLVPKKIVGVFSCAGSFFQSHGLTIVAPHNGFCIKIVSPQNDEKASTCSVFSKKEWPFQVNLKEIPHILGNPLGFHPQWVMKKNRTLVS